MKDEREKEERKNGNDANDGKKVERETPASPARELDHSHPGFSRGNGVGKSHLTDPGRACRHRVLSPPFYPPQGRLREVSAVWVGYFGEGRSPGSATGRSLEWCACTYRVRSYMSMQNHSLPR
jgi:hypothetical protein